MSGSIFLICIVLQLGYQELIRERPAPVAQNTKTAYCSQKTEERESLIREASENQYTIRWVIFAGNERTSDHVLRRRILLQEGEIFTRQNLNQSLNNVSKLKKTIYRVNLNDVIVKVDRSEKVIDMTICFKEKRK